MTHANAAQESRQNNQFQEGEIVGIPCDVCDVPFLGDRVVGIPTIDGEIEGFVQPTELRQIGDQWQIRGVVDRTEKDHLVAWVRGEFFLTAGSVKLPLGLAVPA